MMPVPWQETGESREEEGRGEFEREDVAVCSQDQAQEPPSTITFAAILEVDNATTN